MVEVKKIYDMYFVSGQSVLTSEDVSEMALDYSRAGILVDDKAPSVDCIRACTSPNFPPNVLNKSWQAFCHSRISENCECPLFFEGLCLSKRRPTLVIHS